MNLDHDKVKKVCAWRVISIIFATIINFLFLGEMLKSVFLTIVLTIIMTVLHYIFEEIWESQYEISKTGDRKNGQQ